MFGFVPACLICFFTCFLAGSADISVGAADTNFVSETLSFPEKNLSGSQLSLLRKANSSPGITVSILSCLGAGLFEETCFRLLALSSLLGLARILGGSREVSLGMGLLGSSLLFAMAHEPALWSGQFSDASLSTAILCSYRLLAGIGLALITLKLGLGVAIGAHTCFNLTLLVSDF